MKKIQFSITIMIVVVLSFSCKTHELISVTVVDKITQQPLDSVLVVVTDGEKNDGGDSRRNSISGYTDISGNFKGSLQIGLAFGMNRISLEYSKNGYANKTELNKTTGKVELEH